jgi:hypothetical protein
VTNTHLVFTCQHAHPDHDNDRADYLSRLIIDIRPDVVVNLGDACDLPSLSSFDKGKRAFQGRTYERDIASHIDFQSRIWEPVKARKRSLPRRIFLHGNHEQRIWNALNIQPELDGTIGFNDLQLKDWYTDIVPYSGNTPGTIEIDGITYAHYLSAGVLGRPISGEHPAYTILSKYFTSCTVGHSHTLDFCCRTKADGTKIMAMVAGCYQDYSNDWAGDELGKLWDRGVLIKRNVEGGQYDFQWISLDTLEKEYKNKKNDE